MILLDSNLIIYASWPKHGDLRRFVREEAPLVSVVSKIETLGYYDLSEEEKSFLEEFFDAASALPVTQEVVARAIHLRQRRSMSLGDALIAGTALSYGLQLATHNTDDFRWVEELEIIDPLAS